MMKTVLIADHSLFIRSLLRKLLSKTDYQIVAEAEDGKQAVSKFLGRHPDFVLMDFTMPKLNGFQALHQMMKIDSTANIIMFARVYEQFLIDESQSLGAKDFVLKPDFTGLLASLNNIVQKQHS
jgi:two-component system, chemotaxis family, chemotaxis protein CheY